MGGEGVTFILLIHSRPNMELYSEGSDMTEKRTFRAVGPALTEKIIYPKVWDVDSLKPIIT